MPFEKHMRLNVFTIGHSTHPLDRFLALLAQHGIEVLADIRRFPGSRKFPHFNNLGLRNESFRNYADYMLTKEFRESVKQLLAVATSKPTAFMCSESVFWRCHRRLVSDFLLVNGITIQHIMPSGELRPHTLTKGARAETGELRYPPPDEAADQASTLSE